MCLKYKLKKIFANKFSKKNSLQKISTNFWLNKSADLNSMCGLGYLNDEDLKHTKTLFDCIKREIHFNRALDVGSGIGRITFNFLYERCLQIDLLDLNNHFLDIEIEKN